MFSGIVETQESIVKVKELNKAFTIWVKRPDFFTDLKVGDSIANDGVCLTLEPNELEPNTDVSKCELMQFTLGFETLSILKRKNTSDWLNRKVNLERSLHFGDRVHGHMVTGHVEGVGEVVESYSLGENWIIKIRVSEPTLSYCWHKGSLTVNGTSLTINQVHQGIIEHCLIPETQKRTNLCSLKIGHHVCLESDSMARAVFEVIKNSGIIERLTK